MPRSMPCISAPPLPMPRGAWAENSHHKAVVFRRDVPGRSQFWRVQDNDIILLPYQHIATIFRFAPRKHTNTANTYSSRTRSEFLLICRCLMHERRHILRSDCPPSETISARLKAQRKWKKFVKHKIHIIQGLQFLLLTHV